MGNKDEFNDIHCINISYDRGFLFGYLAAKLGVEWPDISSEQRKLYEHEAREALKRWNEKCEKGC